MDKREEVMKWLDFCIRNTDCSIIECDKSGCPYLGGSEIGSCFTTLMDDAFALLKAQEPRVMTLDEVRDLAGNYEIVWAEDNGSDDCCEGYCSPDLDYRTDEVILWVPGIECEYEPNNGTYGKKWRCWTSKPTLEQMKAVKWE